MKHGRMTVVITIAVTILAGVVQIHSLTEGRGGQDIASLDLNTFLAKAADYADQLEGAVFDFVCREEIKEWVNPALEVKVVRMRGVTGFSSYTPRIPVIKPSRRSLIYDYQCIRKEGKIHERRTLLKENGKEKNDPNASLETSIFRYGTNMMGPVGLFGARFQPSYKYTFVGEERIKGRKVVVIEAIPRFEDPKATNLYGKAWVAADSGNILKIEWNEHRIGYYKIFEERGKKFKRKPRITIRSEFHAEKNGLHFPTNLYIEEAYLNKRGRAFIRSKTTVTYKDFKFFTVEVEVK